MLKLELNKSLIQHIDDACNKFADRDCFVFAEKRYTYKYIQEASCKVANQLIQGGFQKEMREIYIGRTTSKKYKRSSSF